MSKCSFITATKFRCNLTLYTLRLCEAFRDILVWSIQCLLKARNFSRWAAETDIVFSKMDSGFPDNNAYLQLFYINSIEKSNYAEY